MKPIGLTIKNIKTNPFTGKSTGELMIVHLCLGCGRISCNRIAGDDNPYTIIELLETSNMIDVNLSTKLRNLNIGILSEKNKSLVLIAVYGYDCNRKS